MFRKRTPKAPSLALSQLSSLIAEDVEIVGDIRFATGMRIDGRVRGQVSGVPADGGKGAKAGKGALLVLSESGRIEGSVCCHDAVINGVVDGDLEVEHFLELQSKARVTGSIRYRQLQMDVGAAVRGRLQAMALEDDAAAPTAADTPPTAEGPVVKLAAA
jgi:cytoskeletal protein CcmA (bactofilin family)